MKASRLWTQARTDSFIASSGATSCSITRAGANHIAIITSAHSTVNATTPSIMPPAAMPMPAIAPTAMPVSAALPPIAAATIAASSRPRRWKAPTSSRLPAWRRMPSKSASMRRGSPRSSACAPDSMPATSTGSAIGAAAQPRKGSMPSAAMMTKKISAWMTQGPGAFMNSRQPSASQLRAWPGATSPGAGAGG